MSAYPPPIRSQVLFVPFGHPPKRCRIRTGEVTYVQEDGLFLVKDSRYVKPIVFDSSGMSVVEAKRCTSCLRVSRSGTECGLCKTETLVHVNRSPLRYYVHKVTPIP